MPNPNSSTGAHYHSLPARPPPSTSAPPSHLPLKAHNPTNSYGNGVSGYGTPTGGSMSYASAPGLNVGAPATSSGYSSQQRSYYSSSSEQSSYAPPQIVNPFPLPGQATTTSGGGSGSKNGYDPELEAQIAQWQSAYAPKEDGVGRPTVVPKGKDNLSGARTGTSTPQSGTEAHNNYSYPDTSVPSQDKPKTVVRQGGGKQWEDSTLLEWDPAHFRIFVGNLAGEVTDDSLLKAFSKYPSVQKARVVRDKRTTKSKGFGFVSFSDGDEYFKAAKEMQGKYIGSHPVIIRRAMADVRPVAVKDNDKNKKGKNKGGIKGGHANTGAGVQKNQKDKSALRFLG